MQNKGAIRLFAILLAIVCLYQLSFTYFTRSVESDAEEYAQGDRVKQSKYLDSISGEVVYNFFGIRKYTYNECKEKELNLGLDLRGGMNVTLEVLVVDIIKAMAVDPNDTALIRTINYTKELQTQSQKDFVTLFREAFETLYPGGNLAVLFTTIELKGRINHNTSNEDVIAVIREESDAAIANSFNVLRTRIDKFGVTQPNIQQLETAGRILVELPGVKEPERVRKLLQGTANLEFWETYENGEIYQFLIDANERIKEIQEGSGEDAEKDTADIVDSLFVADNEQSTVVEDTALEVLNVEDPDSLTEEPSLLDQFSEDQDTGITLLDELERDTTVKDTAALTGEDWEKAYPLFAVLRPSINSQNQLMKGPVIGMAHVKDTSKVMEYFNMKQVKTIFPRDMKLYWGVKPPKWDESGTVYELYAIKVATRDGKPPLDGDVINNARAEYGQTGGAARVSMSMNGEGAKIWARLTREAVSNPDLKRCIAIVLDGYVYSAPTVQTEIKNGSSEITGNFTPNEAKDLANVLKSGKLPAPARIIDEAIVGPSLGQEAIDSGLSSFAIAFLIVLIYMIFYYNRAGWIANVALLANIYFILGVLASLGAVLTLPGIAGIVLTIGMSVDANVLIYERIREEVALGKGIKLAVSDGYKNAYSAIIDANVTTLLTAIILGYFGKGPIQGFATTLGIGILTSLFSAIFITRLIFTRLLDKNKPVNFATKFTENAFKNLNINFLGRKKLFYVISGIIVAVGVISLVTRGLNQGVDFTGGRTYVVRFDDNVSTLDVQNALKEVYGEAPEVKTFGSANQVKITTKYLIEELSDTTDLLVEQKLHQGLLPLIGDNVSFEKFIDEYRMSSQKVGPTIADDIKIAAVWAILFSLVIIFIYILFRFKKWQYSLGAIAALVHDVLIVLGLFSILYGILPFSLEIDQAFIAAILTVVGYSINDTVVVFDRIREHLGLYKKRERKELFNTALNSTISRTFSTSLSTFVVLLVIFIFGGEVIRGFTFALLIGVIVGTYSSLFIATPVAFDVMKKPAVNEPKHKRRK